jgi:hypothetical protein
MDTWKTLSGSHEKKKTQVTAMMMLLMRRRRSFVFWGQCYNF